MVELGWDKEENPKNKKKSQTKKKKEKPCTPFPKGLKIVVIELLQSKLTLGGSFISLNTTNQILLIQDLKTQFFFIILINSSAAVLHVGIIKRHNSNNHNSEKEKESEKEESLSQTRERRIGEGRGGGVGVDSSTKRRYSRRVYKKEA